MLFIPLFIALRAVPVCTTRTLGSRVILLAQGIIHFPFLPFTIIGLVSTFTLDPNSDSVKPAEDDINALEMRVFAWNIGAAGDERQCEHFNLPPKGAVHDLAGIDCLNILFPTEMSDFSLVYHVAQVEIKADYVACVASIKFWI